MGTGTIGRPLGVLYLTFLPSFIWTNSEPMEETQIRNVHDSHLFTLGSHVVPRVYHVHAPSLLCISPSNSHSSSHCKCSSSKFFSVTTQEGDSLPCSGIVTWTLYSLMCTSFIIRAATAGVLVSEPTQNHALHLVVTFLNLYNV